MALYSYKGAEPTELPTRLRIAAEDAPSGATETRTHLDKLSDDELKDLDLIRVDLTEYDDTKYYRVWNSENRQYDAIELDRQEKIARQHTPQPDLVADWVTFEEKFSSLEINKKLYESGDPFLVQIISQTKGKLKIITNWHVVDNANSLSVWIKPKKMVDENYLILNANP